MRASTLLTAALTIGIAAPIHSQELFEASAPLEQFIADDDLSVQLTNPGKHMGESIVLEVTNDGYAPRTFSLPAGWVFDSVDEGTQNLLLVRAVELEVPAGATVSIACEAYCVEPNKSGPGRGAPYLIGYMGGESTTQLARFIDAHRFRDQAAILSALWATLGERPVGSIKSDDPGETELLQAKVRDLLGVPAPDQLLSEVQ